MKYLLYLVGAAGCAQAILWVIFAGQGYISEMRQRPNMQATEALGLVLVKAWGVFMVSVQFLLLGYHGSLNVDGHLIPVWPLIAGALSLAIARVWSLVLERRRSPKTDRMRKNPGF